MFPETDGTARVDRTEMKVLYFARSIKFFCFQKLYVGCKVSNYSWKITRLGIDDFTYSAVNQYA